MFSNFLASDIQLQLRLDADYLKNNLVRMTTV